MILQSAAVELNLCLLKFNSNVLLLKMATKVYGQLPQSEQYLYKGTKLQNFCFFSEIDLSSQELLFKMVS